MFGLRQCLLRVRRRRGNASPHPFSAAKDSLTACLMRAIISALLRLVVPNMVLGGGNDFRSLRADAGTFGKAR